MFTHLEWCDACKSYHDTRNFECDKYRIKRWVFGTKHMPDRPLELLSEILNQEYAVGYTIGSFVDDVPEFKEVDDYMISCGARMGDKVFIVVGSP